MNATWTPRPAVAPTPNKLPQSRAEKLLAEWSRVEADARATAVQGRLLGRPCWPPQPQAAVRIKRPEPSWHGALSGEGWWSAAGSWQDGVRASFPATAAVVGQPETQLTSVRRLPLPPQGGDEMGEKERLVAKLQFQLAAAEVALSQTRCGALVRISEGLKLTGEMQGQLDGQAGTILRLQTELLAGETSKSATTRESWSYASPVCIEPTPAPHLFSALNITSLHVT